MFAFYSGTGKYITATTEDGGFQATLEVTAKGETGLYDLTGNTTDADLNTIKQLRDGQLVIIRNGVVYSATGQRITNHK